MLKKSFFGLSRPSFHYESLSESEPMRIDIPSSKTVTLHIKGTPPIFTKSGEEVKVGSKVKTGQKIYLPDSSKVYTISSITGTVGSILPVTSADGASHTAISINASNNEELDKAFSEVCDTPNLKIMRDFLGSCPGEPPMYRFVNEAHPINTIMIYGGNSGLLVHNDLKIITDKSETINEGIRLLKATTEVKNLVLIVPGGTIQNYSDHFDVTVKTVSSEYPYAHPMMAAYLLTGKVPRHKDAADLADVCFFRAEAVDAIGRAFKKGALPVRKNLTVVGKDRKKYLIRTRIGTHASHIFENLGIEIMEEDKIIFGDLMTGNAVHTESYPILLDTDLIVVQGKDAISKYSDYPCINCGECVRVCPAKVPVNLLVRFLEVGQYEEGADLYDLYSCVECGLCSYVCVSKIPIFQYIKLAKYELNRTGYAEEMNE